MRRYADKVFEKDARLGRMTDGRRDPTLPLAAVLAPGEGELTAALRLLQRLLRPPRRAPDGRGSVRETLRRLGPQ
jgi:hypothetical protein